MRLLVRAILILGLMWHQTLAANPANTADSVEALFDNSGIPGASYGATSDGIVTKVGALGLIEIGAEARVTEDSAFLIGSVSKSFTALGVMQLVEAGDVALDAPISAYLKRFENAPASDVTIRQLLSHTSGFSMLQGNAEQDDFSMDKDALADRVGRLVDQQLANPPGSKWEYSNANYQILGRLIEAVSGSDYASYVENNILIPAGMENSYVHKAAIDARLVSGHQPWFGAKRALTQNMTGLGSAPQGGIVSSGHDMARYLSIMMNGKDDILSAAGKTQMMQPASIVSPRYGFGWFINPDKGLVYHSGANPGFEALATMVPAERKGVAVLVNAGSGTGFGDTDHFRHAASALLIDVDYENREAGALPKMTFLLVTSLPVLFLLASLWAYVKRAKLAEKTQSWFGHFSLWFPLLTTSVIAVLVFAFLPQVIGAPLSAIRYFQPDMWLGILGIALLGPAWAIWRLVLAYKTRPTSS
ncbi:MAG: serine hydrolase domain-containing protein [Pseudomonadota bacterium]